MHPVVILVPVLALIFGPRLWVGQVLKASNRRDLASTRSAGELARELLDKNRLQAVMVESTDIGDHYDPISKAVRLGRDKIDRRTLTAFATAAHEVAHALQDASGYGPFVWRTRLVKVAQRAGEASTVLFLAIPLSAIFSRNNPFPPVATGAAAVVMLGTGLIVQLAALPSELDASFGRALPMLREGYINKQQEKEARKILWACSLTYVASSLVSVLHIWPWIGRLPLVLPVMIPIGPAEQGGGMSVVTHKTAIRARRSTSGVCSSAKRKNNSLLETLVRPIGKPLIRLWLRVAESP